MVVNHIIGRLMTEGGITNGYQGWRKFWLECGLLLVVNFFLKSSLKSSWHLKSK